YILTPFFRAVSTDLNFTLALALISVIMTQVIGVQTQGMRYFTKFINFTTMFKKPVFGFIDFLVGLLELISEFAKILSFTFRLFGVMFSGFVLVALVATMLPVFVPSMIYMFEIFMGVIQAFVFGMLTMVFMAMATRGHGGEEHH
ncbi:MAG: F0F1 ATP synthase subunit A, partial [Chloroflexota bacterium]